jgi:hypothetical protein
MRAPQERLLCVTAWNIYVFTYGSPGSVPMTHSSKKECMGLMMSGPRCTEFHVGVDPSV